MPGGDLAEYVKKHPDADRLKLVCAPSPMPDDVFTPCKLRDIADGLDYLHSGNMIHGDLKGVRDCSESSSSY